MAEVDTFPLTGIGIESPSQKTKKANINAD